MIEQKRFEWMVDDLNKYNITIRIVDNEKNRSYGMCDIITLLNYLNDKNKHLKMINDEDSNTIDSFANEEVRLITENEKLKKENKDIKQQFENIKQQLLKLQKDNSDNIDDIASCQEENTSVCEEILDLESENEKLKNQIKMLQNTIIRNETYINQIQHRGEWHT